MNFSIPIFISVQALFWIGFSFGFEVSKQYQRTLSCDEMKALEQANGRIRALEYVLNDLLNDCINYDDGNLTEKIMANASKILKDSK